MTLSAAEARFLETRDRILARRNPELLERENAEFEAMTDAELVEIVRRVRPDFDRTAHVCYHEPFARVSEGFDESSFADRYGADVTEAATGLMQSADELWLKWCELIA